MSAWCMRFCGLLLKIIFISFGKMMSTVGTDQIRIMRSCRLGGVIICDAIKQNESDSEKIETQFSFPMYALIIPERYHAIKIEHTVPKL